MQETKNYKWAIVKNPDSDLDELKEQVKKENELTDKDLEGFEAGYLFNIIDNIRYCVFDVDVVLFNKEKETYEHTGNSDTMEPVENRDIEMLIDENGEAKAIN